MNILVTGAGSLIGHGILRSLRVIKEKKFKIFTADPDHRAAGHWLGHHALRIPLAKETHYLSELNQLINRYEIDIVFIGTDPELLKISSATETLKATVVVSKPSSILIADDKWETVKFLRQNGFSYPDSVLFDKKEELRKLIERVGFPLIAKPRIGARSSGVFKIMTPADLDKINNTGSYIIQEFLPEEAGEFTAGTMTYEGVCFSQVIFRRDLRDGNTYRAYLYENKRHEEMLKKISVSLPGVYGPMNFQYRIKNDQPVIFEINSRFSGTTPLRTAIGINEVEMALEYITEGSIHNRKKSHHNVAILRTWSDIIVPFDQIEMFAENNQLESPKALYFPFMD